MWFKGSVTPVWDNSYKDFSFIKQPLTNEEINLWRSQGYTHNTFTGEMYDSKNPMPTWCDTVAEEIGLENAGFVIYKMKTNNIMPTHVDHFRRYCEFFKVERKDVWRAIVFLEDWKPGHYFEINGECFANYSAGDYVIWSADVPHAASNIGIEDRYTLQITGTKVG